MSVFFEIDPSNGVPVYEQVTRQIIFAIASGVIVPGEMIPSVREQARTLAINPNTVARAYRQLQDDKIVEAVRGSGMTVAKGATARCATIRTKLIRERVRHVIEEARRSQLSDEEISAIVSDELGATKKKQRRR